MRYTTAAIGKLIRETRIELGLTQESLAMTSGVGRRFVVELEHGKSTCELGKVLNVLNMLGIEVIMTPPNSTSGR